MHLQIQILLLRSSRGLGLDLGRLGSIEKRWEVPMIVTREPVLVSRSRGLGSTSEYAREFLDSVFGPKL